MVLEDPIGCSEHPIGSSSFNAHLEKEAGEEGRDFVPTCSSSRLGDTVPSLPSLWSLLLLQSTSCADPNNCGSILLRLASTAATTRTNSLS